MNSSNTEVSKWLKAKDQAIAHSSIFEYWQSFWLRLDRTRPEFAARTEALLVKSTCPSRRALLCSNKFARARGLAPLMVGLVVSSSICLVRSLMFRPDCSWVG